MTGTNKPGVLSTIKEAAVIYFKNFPLLFSLLFTGMIPMLGYMYAVLKDPKFTDKSTLLAVAIFMPLAIVLGLACYGAGYKAFSSLYKGESAGFLDSYKTGFQRMFRLLSSSIFLFLWTLLGLVMLIIPGIVFTLKYSLAPVAAVLEDVKISPLKMSAKLTKGSKWQIFAAFILIYVPVLIPSLLVNYLGGAYSNPPVMPDIKMMLLGMIPGLLLGPLFLGIMVVFYEKLKAVKIEELKEEQLKGMNTPLGCLVSFLIFVAAYAAIIAGVVVVVKALHLDLKKPATISRSAAINQAQDNAGKAIKK